ncbi:phospholipase A2 inhibitor and Ly6/PLAUR domain-containing protein-like [Pleurodeles waltl]|uniref:phospholipase A2 inhibitor and Ly6/PLAUR domain-containing protein-like n=1 Tax=Pleurodeles waltl TaxID=8319 RepID=UPI0037097F25
MTCGSRSDACVSKYTETTADGYLKKEFLRSCGTFSENCNRIESLTSQHLEIRGNSTCCTTNDCLPPTPTVPVTGTTLNGVMCRTCVTGDSTYCYTRDTIECKGIQNKCVHLGIKTTGKVYSTVAFRGCGSPHLCATGTFVSTSEDVTTEITMQCSDSAIRPEHGLFLTAITFLLLKLLH